MVTIYRIEPEVGRKEFELFERQTGIVIPGALQTFYSLTNGGMPIEEADPPPYFIQMFFPLCCDDPDRPSVRSVREELIYENSMAEGWMPIADRGESDYFIVSSKTGEVVALSNMKNSLGQIEDFLCSYFGCPIEDIRVVDA